MSYLRFLLIWVGCVTLTLLTLGLTAYVGRARSPDSGRLLGVSVGVTSLLVAVALGSIAAVLVSSYLARRTH